MTKLEDIKYSQDIEQHCHQGTWEDFKKSMKDITEEEYKPKKDEWYVWTDFEDINFGATTDLSYYKHLINEDKNISTEDIKKRTFDFLVDVVTKEWEKCFSNREFCSECGQEIKNEENKS